MRQLERQHAEQTALFAGISEEKSAYRYAPEKWSIRQSLNHLTDTERMFTFRALWFGRGFTAPLESFDDKTAAAAAQADRVSWSEHVQEFGQVRPATISLFRHMPEEAWLATGVANGNPVSVRALAFLIAQDIRRTTWNFCANATWFEPAPLRADSSCRER